MTCGRIALTTFVTRSIGLLCMYLFMSHSVLQKPKGKKAHSPQHLTRTVSHKRYIYYNMLYQSHNLSSSLLSLPTIPRIILRVRTIHTCTYTLHTEQNNKPNQPNHISEPSVVTVTLPILIYFIPITTIIPQLEHLCIYLYDTLEHVYVYIMFHPSEQDFYLLGQGDIMFANVTSLPLVKQ